MLVQHHARARDLYQTDLDRHLFAIDGTRPVAAWSRKNGRFLDDLRGRWTLGWERWKAALADIACFL